MSSSECFSSQERKSSKIFSENRIHQNSSADFGNIRDKFEQDMKQMEDEMEKFRENVFSRESSHFNRNISTTRGSGDILKSAGGNLGSHSNWLQGMDSKSTIHGGLDDSVDESGSMIGKSVSKKDLKLSFDLSQYTPEEITVRTVDDKLMIHAIHEEKTEGKSVFREYSREFRLPKGTDGELIKSSLTRDGILTVEAPMPESIHIDFLKEQCS